MENKQVIFLILSFPLVIIVYVLTKGSVEKFLKSKIGKYYPFNLIVAGSHTWSVIYFLIISSLFALILYIYISKGLQ